MARAEIRRIGTATQIDGRWVLDGWMFAGGDGPCITLVPGPDGNLTRTDTLCGWDAYELAAIAEAQHAPPGD